MSTETGKVARERAEAFKRLRLKQRCPVCNKRIGSHCPKRLQVCFNTYVQMVKEG
jgi:hypothetical protein